MSLQKKKMLNGLRKSLRTWQEQYAYRVWPDEMAVGYPLWYKLLELSDPKDLELNLNYDIEGRRLVEFLGIPVRPDIEICGERYKFLKRRVYCGQGNAS